MALWAAAPPHYFVTTTAGMVPSADNPIAKKQYLDRPAAAAYDARGVLYYADATRVWRLNPDGTDTQVAGSIKPTNIQTGPALNVDFSDPGITAMAFDAQGDLYIAAGALYKMTPDQQVTVSLSEFGVATVTSDASGNVFAAGYSDARLMELPAASKSWSQIFELPGSDTFTAISASGGAVYFIDSSQEAVREFTPGNTSSSIVLDLASAESFLWSVAALPNGSFYVASPTRIYEQTPGAALRVVAGTGIAGFSGDGGPAALATVSPSANQIPAGIVAVSPVNGDLAIVEERNHVFRLINGATHNIDSVAGLPHFGGDNGPAILARFDAAAPPYLPGGLASDSQGNLYLFDRNNARVRKVTPAGTITTIAGNGIPGTSGDEGKAIAAEIHASPNSDNICVDQNGNVYFVDGGNGSGDVIRMIDAGGIIHTVAGGGASTSLVSGSKATAMNLGMVEAIAPDAEGNVYIAITLSVGGRSQILKKDGSGVLSSVAGNLTGATAFSPDGTAASRAFVGTVHSMTTDGAGLLYYADDWFNVIRMIDSQGNLHTVAGLNAPVETFAPVVAGIATATQLNFPTALTFDPAGNFYFVHTALYGQQIVMVDRAGNLAPIGGKPPADGFESRSGDGGDSLDAVFGQAMGLAADASGSIYVLDSGVYVRKLAPYDTTNPPPFVATGGIIGAGASFPAVAAISPNGDASLYGANFGPSHPLSGSDLVNGQVPNNLGGVCVSIGGVAAAMLGVFSGQINVQVPSLRPGPTTVQVTLNCGTSKAVSSNLAAAVVQTVSPEFFAFAPDPIAGNNPIAAVNALTGAYVGPPGLLKGVTFVPAKAGDIVAAFGTGWGGTNPAIGLGVIPGGAASLASAYTVTLGGVMLPSSSIQYAGVSPCCAGLYQLNFTIPQGTPSGNQPLVITVDGVASPPHAFLAVQ